jgi:hypothetical protein
MSSVLTKIGRNFIPASEAGERFGYTRDYIIMLARDGKITGKKIGHKWYVDGISVESFFNTSKVEREARRRKLSEERKRELGQNGTSSERSGFVLEVAAIFLLTVVLGVSGFVASLSPSTHTAAVGEVAETSFFNDMTGWISKWFGTHVVHETYQEDPATSATPETLEVSRETHATRTVHTSIVVGPDEVMSTTEIESIRDAFSDDVSVSVDPHNPDSGLIVPHFKEEDGEAFRFLMVPVNENEE